MSSIRFPSHISDQMTAGFAGEERVDLSTLGLAIEPTRKANTGEDAFYFVHRKGLLEFAAAVNFNGAAITVMLEACRLLAVTKGSIKLTHAVAQELGISPRQLRTALAVLRDTKDWAIVTQGGRNAAQLLPTAKAMAELYWATTGGKQKASR